MTATRTPVVKQFQQDWVNQLEPEALQAACRGVASRWRERMLDPVTTIPWFFVQILHGNTACTLLRHLSKLNVPASASCQARMQLPLAVFQQLLRSVRRALQPAPLDEGRWLGHRTLWVDGSNCSMPDTPALQVHGVHDYHRIVCDAVGIDQAWYQGAATEQNSPPWTTPP